MSNGQPAGAAPPASPATRVLGTVLVLLICCVWSRVSEGAGQLPSLFRGVVVADSGLGVRVVSVEEGSQPHQADLRAEDVIVQVDGREVHSIDEFAILSRAMKGRATRATVLVFRSGAPRELVFHLYSYPLLREWGIEFVPEDDVRFAQPEIALAYWSRLGRGFEDAGKPEEALNAYLNGLHNAPADGATALKISELFASLGQRALQEGALLPGVTSLRQSLVMMERLFEYPLSDEQLGIIRRLLSETLQALQQASAHRTLEK